MAKPTTRPKMIDFKARLGTTQRDVYCAITLDKRRYLHRFCSRLFNHHRARKLNLLKNGNGFNTQRGRSHLRHRLQTHHRRQ